MAIYHLSVKCVGRSRGQSATAAAAYRSAQKIRDERSGELHDYSRKAGVLHRELVLPDGAPGWARLRERLWNEAEAAETRKNSTVAREFEIALPAELPARERARLAVDLARDIVARHRCAVDVSVHGPGRRGDGRNHHAHLLCTTRRLQFDGFRGKTRELDQAKTGEVSYWRHRWASLANERLRERCIEARVDHRTLEAQGIDRVPTSHRGPAITALLRRGEVAYVDQRREAERIEEVQARIERAAERGRVEREARECDRMVVDLSGDIAAARWARDRSAQNATEARSSVSQSSVSLESWREALHSAPEREKQREAQRQSDRNRGLEAEKDEYER